MIEQVYQLSQGEKKVIERVVMDENLHYMHMTLPKGESLPDHHTNGNVYMTVARGTLSIALGEEERREYPVGTLLKIPEGILMKAGNPGEETLELIVVKAPAPKS